MANPYTYAGNEYALQSSERFFDGCSCSSDAHFLLGTLRLNVDEVISPGPVVQDFRKGHPDMIGWPFLFQAWAETGPAV